MPIWRSHLRCKLLNLPYVEIKEHFHSFTNYKAVYEQHLYYTLAILFEHIFLYALGYCSVSLQVSAYNKICCTNMVTFLFSLSYLHAHSLFLFNSLLFTVYFGSKFLFSLLYLLFVRQKKTTLHTKFLFYFRQFN